MATYTIDQQIVSDALHCLTWDDIGTDKERRKREALQKMDEMPKRYVKQKMLNGGSRVIYISPERAEYSRRASGMEYEIL